jgi:phosphoribosylaminoimidazole-succinocarboxamide synthase
VEIQPTQYSLPPEFVHLYSGKVRDLYRTPDNQLLFVASDRISAYDWVLPTEIPDKGRILTALSLWWFERLADIVPNHVLSTEVPEAVKGRAMICQSLEMFPVECVARGYLTGSGLVEYRETQSVCGVQLPAGLIDGSRLAQPIFTPATKAELGDHDENVDFEHVVATIGQADAAALRDLTLAVYSRAEGIAREQGVLLADTKFEFGRRSSDGHIILADEVLTPDSSRYWPADLWHPGQSQPSFDKQYLRDWLTSPASGWDKSGTLPPPELPAEVVAQTRAKYIEAYERITGQEWSDSL